MTKIPNHLLSELIEVYRWACGFTHTGKREYIWFILEALQAISPLFLYEENKKYKISTCDRLNYLTCTTDELASFLSKEMFNNKNEVILTNQNFEIHHGIWWDRKNIYL